ncbi:UPF0489 family protein [Sulfurimonas sp.]|uniref:UPF0489 family protein n=1 Tax=Sulfurimonas sp. TaxID=2022749 RepID=UPI00261D5C10|nr:UPF0489 family protein [Sulfurimonas sp.]MDD3854088.1 UPF0489 family protein [Sulfurimonas sp.]
MNHKTEQIINQINFEKNDEYFDEIYPNIWIMDNHKWALYCWEQYRVKNQIPSTLVHIDYHWDAVNDYYENEDKLKNIDLDTMKNIISEEQYIRKDSFIAPAIIRKFINRVDFYCFQNNTEVGLDSSLLTKYQVKQNIYSQIDDLVKPTGTCEIILDIDLDIFNTIGSKFGKLWSKDKIINYINKLSPLIKKAKIITIAMSYGYTGSNEEIEYLTKLVIPLIIETRTVIQEENKQ